MLRPSQGPGVARTWTQPAVLWEPLQAVLQQHRDNPVQVRHLTGVVGRRGEQRGRRLCRTQAAWICHTLAAVWTSACLPVTSSLGLVPPVPDSVTLSLSWSSLSVTTHHSDSLGLSSHRLPSVVGISLWPALSQLPAGSSHVALPGVLSITAQKS